MQVSRGDASTSLVNEAQLEDIEDTKTHNASYHTLNEAEAAQVAALLVLWYRRDRRHFPWRSLYRGTTPDQGLPSRVSVELPQSSTPITQSNNTTTSSPSKGNNSNVSTAISELMTIRPILSRVNASVTPHDSIMYTLRSCPKQCTPVDIQKHLHPPHLNLDAQTLDERWREIFGNMSVQDFAYRVWISEVMSQQTRIETVVGYFNRWMESLPTLASAATATDQLLTELWQGLGFYRRLHNLVKGLKYVHHDLGGIIPQTLSGLLQIPGIGPYTAGAIASLAFGLPVPAYDTNVQRVVARLRAIGAPITSSVGERLGTGVAASIVGASRGMTSAFLSSFASAHPLAKTWPTSKTIHEYTPDFLAGELTQSLIELGALVCTPKNPNCTVCPVRGHCLAYQQQVLGTWNVPPPPFTQTSANVPQSGTAPQLPIYPYTSTPLDKLKEEHPALASVVSKHTESHVNPFFTRSGSCPDCLPVNELQGNGEPHEGKDDLLNPHQGKEGLERPPLVTNYPVVAARKQPLLEAHVSIVLLRRKGGSDNSEANYHPLSSNVSYSSSSPLPSPSSASPSRSTQTQHPIALALGVSHNLSSSSSSSSSSLLPSTINSSNSAHDDTNAKNPPASRPNKGGNVKGAASGNTILRNWLKPSNKEEVKVEGKDENEGTQMMISVEDSSRMASTTHTVEIASIPMFDPLSVSDQLEVLMIKRSSDSILANQWDIPSIVLSEQKQRKSTKKKGTDDNLKDGKVHGDEKEGVNDENREYVDGTDEGTNDISEKGLKVKGKKLNKSRKRKTDIIGDDEATNVREDGVDESLVSGTAGLAMKILEATPNGVLAEDKRKEIEEECLPLVKTLVGSDKGHVVCECLGTTTSVFTHRIHRRLVFMAAIPSSLTPSKVNVEVESNIWSSSSTSTTSTLRNPTIVSEQQSPVSEVMIKEEDVGAIASLGSSTFKMKDAETEMKSSLLETESSRWIGLETALGMSGLSSCGHRDLSLLLHGRASGPDHRLKLFAGHWRNTKGKSNAKNNYKPNQGNEDGNNDDSNISNSKMKKGKPTQSTGNQRGKTGVKDTDFSMNGKAENDEEETPLVNNEGTGTMKVTNSWLSPIKREMTNVEDPGKVGRDDDDLSEGRVQRGNNKVLDDNEDDGDAAGDNDDDYDDDTKLSLRRKRGRGTSGNKSLQSKTPATKRRKLV